ncbi:MAG: ATP-binding protein [Desulfobacteraceae bacterium]
MSLKKVKHAVGRAVQDYAMIRENDRVLLAVSGGMDSMVLLTLLSILQSRAPVRFSILPVYIDPGFENSFAHELETYVKENFEDIRIESTGFGVYAHTEENTENPCFLCSRLRRKRLFEIAKEEGCSRIALGHHKDDIIETLFMNILYSGRIGTMKPSQPFFQDTFRIIRPLCYLEKEEIRRFHKDRQLPEFRHSCPSEPSTKRRRVRRLLNELYEESSHIKGNIFSAMGNVSDQYLLEHTL